MENKLKNKRYTHTMEAITYPDFGYFHYFITEDMLVHLYCKEEADKLRTLIISSTQIENKVNRTPLSKYGIISKANYIILHRFLIL
jgi:hypothetical protein